MEGYFWGLFWGCIGGIMEKETETITGFRASRMATTVVFQGKNPKP